MMSQSYVAAMSNPRIRLYGSRYYDDSRPELRQECGYSPTT